MRRVARVTALFTILLAINTADHFIDTAQSWAILESFEFARGLSESRGRAATCGEGKYEWRAKLEREGH